MTEPIERVLIVLDPSGALVGAHCETARGLAVPLTMEALASVLPDRADLLADLCSARKAREQVEFELASVRAELSAMTAARDALMPTANEQ